MCPQNLFFDFHSVSCRGKCAPKTCFSTSIQPARLLLRKKLKKYSVPHFPQKRFLSFFVIRHLTPVKNTHVLEIIFRDYFGKYCFSQKNCKMKNMQNLISYKKSYIDFCRQAPLPLKTVVSSHKWFFQVFFQKYCFF